MVSECLLAGWVNCSRYTRGKNRREEMMDDEASVFFLLELIDFTRLLLIDPVPCTDYDGFPGFCD